MINIDIYSSYIFPLHFVTRPFSAVTEEASLEGSRSSQSQPASPEPAGQSDDADRSSARHVSQSQAVLVSSAEFDASGNNASNIRSHASIRLGRGQVEDSNQSEFQMRSQSEEVQIVRTGPHESGGRWFRPVVLSFDSFNTVSKPPTYGRRGNSNIINESASLNARKTYTPYSSNKKKTDVKSLIRMFER